MPPGQDNRSIGLSLAKMELTDTASHVKSICKHASLAAKKIITQWVTLYLDKLSHADWARFIIRYHHHLTTITSSPVPPSLPSQPSSPSPSSSPPPPPPPPPPPLTQSCGVAGDVMVWAWLQYQFVGGLAWVLWSIMNIIGRKYVCNL